MKILLYSDLHLGADRVDIGKVEETLKWINNISEQEKCDNIINLGDTFDFYNHTKSKMKITPELMTILSKIGVLFKNHIVLRGNHEYHEEGDLLPVLDMFEAKVIVEPTEIDNLLLMPYYDDLGLEKLNYPFKEHYKYVFGHYDISGASFESGFKEQSKDSNILNKFKFDYMYIGHYHIRQKIRANIESVGSCQSRVKSDNETKMGITILDTNTGEAKFIENPYAEYNPSDRVKIIGTQYTTSKKYNLLDEIDNFKLEKTGLEAIIEYTKSKKGVYDEVIVDYTLEYLESLRK